VEEVRSPGLSVSRSREKFSTAFQVCLPYRGLFVWHVGGDEVVGDANQVLFVAGGETYHLSQPRSGDYAEMIITPDPELLEELAGRPVSSMACHPLFRHRSQRVDFELQQMRTRFLQRATLGNGNAFALEESAVTLLRSALDTAPRASQPSRMTRRLMRRAKGFLEANLGRRLRLADVARAVGASPAYLTDTFRRVEGIPLHAYLTQLRLARALVDLRHADNLTTLAFDLGFSSHSHFTAAFRRAFGCTPSQFRDVDSHDRSRHALDPNTAGLAV
jgi:AraC-like DNA-binding protein